MRAGEHKKDLDKHEKTSTLWEQCAISHNSIKQEFLVKVIRGHTSPFSRQIHEGILIIENNNINTLNRKVEYNGSTIPNIIIEVNGKTREDKLCNQNKRLLDQDNIQGSKKSGGDRA